MRNRSIFEALASRTVILLASALAPANMAWAALPSFPQTPQNVSTPTVPRGQKLVMKDGTVQIVSSYQLDGDRVRYFSAERSEWEEIPASLIDWPATKQAETQARKAEASLTAKIKTSDAAAESPPVDVDASFEVVPGVFLPPGEGFFILDGNAVFPLKQSPASAKLDKGHFIEQIAVPVPVIPSRASVDLPGRRASFRTTNPVPEFYFRTKDSSEPEIELLVAKVNGNKRHVENIDTLFGQRNQKGKTVLLQEWRVANGLYRFTLGQPLPPGEYALAQFSPKEGINLLLWDFGVDSRKAKKK